MHWGDVQNYMQVLAILFYEGLEYPQMLYLLSNLKLWDAEKQLLGIMW